MSRIDQGYSYMEIGDPEEHRGPGSLARKDPDEEYDRWRQAQIEADLNLTDNRTGAEIEREMETDSST